LRLQYDETLLNFAFKFNLRRYTMAHACFNVLRLPRLAPGRGGVAAGAYTRPLFQLNVSTFCGIRWVHDFPPVY
jgi:hypothetical protein